MDRRESIRSIILGSIGISLALPGCNSGEEQGPDIPVAGEDAHYFGRTPDELKQIEKLNAEQFLSEHEMDTVKVLADLILPPNEEFGGCVDAGVHDFIEFMAKDIPEIQTILRGGLMWLDHHSNTRFGIDFKDSDEADQKELLDTIAYYDPDIPLGDQPLEIRFFSLMRNLTVCGYYSSEIGIKDLGYKGNTPNVWDGVPQEVLDKHGLSYDEAWLAKCIDQSTRGEIAKWDKDGNLIT